MSFPLPDFRWFDNGNPYSGAEGGMRYLVMPEKEPDPDAEGKKRTCLTAVIWPGPWSLEHTADEKQERKHFPGGVESAAPVVEWLQERYAAEPEKWENIPSILDCEPDK